MDIHFYFHRWLLSMALALLLHQCQDVTVLGEAGRVCSQGLILHRFERYNQEYVTCCRPTRCDVGKEVKQCITNGTHDTCEACGPFTNQSHRTSSFTMNKKCVPWPLNAKCQMGGHLNTNDVRTQRCLCDVEKGFKFSKPELTYAGAPTEAYCQASNMPCDPGQEPTIDGDCKACDKDHFKATRSYQLCEPKTNCTLLGLKFTFQSDATADNNCSEAEIPTTPEAVVTPETKKQTVITTPSKSVSPTSTSKGDESESGSAENTKDQDGDDDDDIAVWPIIFAVIFVLIVVVVIGFILFLRRRRIPMCSCLGLKGSDPEKYTTTQCPSSLPVGDHHYKNVPTGGHYIDSHLSPGEKVMNNNVNGGLIHTIESQHMTNIPRPHLQQNGVNFVQFSGTDSSDSESQMHFQNQQNSFQANVVPPSARPGILRNGNKPHHGQIVYAQARATRPQDASMDSIGREKLHVNIDRYQANQDLGENDPLLIADDVTGSGTLQGQGVVFQNRGNLGPHHSPPVPQAASSQVVYLPHNANFNPHCQNVAGYMHPISNINPNYSGSTSSGNSSPAIQPGQPTHQVTFAPTLDTVTFKRSISVIANPEGEAEEELEANVPRFSQLLPDGEDPSLASNPILRMAQDRETMPMDSPQRDTTHQTRTPSERLQMRPPQNPLAPTFVSPAPPEPLARHQLLNQRPPYFTRRSGGSMENMPDHCIMDLKEHQLANSLSSSSANGSSGETMLKHTADTDFNLDNFMASADQTDMKTLGGTIKEEDPSPGAGANSKVHPLGTTGIGPEARPRKSSGGGVTAQNVSDGNAANNSAENKMFPLGINSVDRKRTPSGGSTGVSNLAERKRVPSGDKQKSCLKNLGQEDGQCVNKRPQRLGRGVSFEEDEARRENSLGQDTEPKQIRDSINSSDDPNLSSDDGKEAKKSGGQISEFNSGDEDNSKFMRTHGGDTDLSSSESTNSSPSRANVYRRSQSESTAGSSDSAHKPPPRSLSEEKSQKADRPIAKVKPMPASDSSVNQLPPGGVEETTTATSSLTNEDSGDESSLEFSAPELHSSNPGEDADEEEEEEEEEHRGAVEEEGRL